MFAALELHDLTSHVMVGLSALAIAAMFVALWMPPRSAR